MAISYPTSLDSLTNPDHSSGDKLNTAGVLHDQQHANANDGVEALEAKVGVNRSTVTSSHEYWLRMGWIYTADTWTYASATTFTIASVDRTAEFSPGTKITLTQSTGGTKYWYVKSSTFSTNTTVTLAPNDDYTLENEAITAPMISYSASPIGFPSVINYSPTFSGFSVNPPGVHAYSIIGNVVTLHVDEISDGTSNATDFSLTLPIDSISDTEVWGVCGFSRDNTAATTHHATWRVDNSVSSVIFYPGPDATGTTWTSSGGKRTRAFVIYKV
jgi:hypothetical protein